MPLALLQLLIADCPSAVSSLEAYPQLLQRLVASALTPAGPAAALQQVQPSFAKTSPSVNHRWDMRQAAVRCIALLAEQDERAWAVLLDQLLPAAVTSSEELLWQSMLAECRRALHARAAAPCWAGAVAGADKGLAAFSLQRVVSSSLSGQVDGWKGRKGRRGGHAGAEAVQAGAAAGLGARDCHCLTAL